MQRRPSDCQRIFRCCRFLPDQHRGRALSGEDCGRGTNRCPDRFSAPTLTAHSAISRATGRRRRTAAARTRACWQVACFGQFSSTYYRAEGDQTTAAGGHQPAQRFLHPRPHGALSWSAREALNASSEYGRELWYLHQTGLDRLAFLNGDHAGDWSNCLWRAGEVCWRT